MEVKEFNEALQNLHKNTEQTVDFFLYCVKMIKFHLLPRFGASPEAEDFAHDIFKRIYENPNLGYVEKPLAWLYRITDNYVSTVMSKENKYLPLLDNFQYELYVDEFSDKETGKLLFGQLDKTSKNVLMLHEKFGYRYKEIAEMLGLTHANVRTIASRAIKKVKKNAAKLHLDEV